MAHGHRQRLRERFLRYGLDSFTDEEVVETLLALGTPRKDCKVQARELCKRFGGLALILEASSEKLQEVKGIGPKNIFALKFIHEVARRFLRQQLQERRQIRSAADITDYLCHALSFRDREVFVTVFLDSQNGIIDLEELFVGTAHVTAVYPREVMRKALLKNATALIFAHNHPSGSLNPSAADMNMTRQLVHAGDVVGVKVLDHILIGGPSSYYSFAEHGILEADRRQGDVRIS